VAEAELARLLILTHRFGFWGGKTEIAEPPAAADRPSLALLALRLLSASVDAPPMPVDLKALAIALIAGLGGLAVIMLLSRWWASTTANRTVARIIRETPITGSSESPKLMPESRSVVDITDSEVSCTRPDKTVERVGWDDLESVELVTTDQGPFLPDVFWVLHGSAGVASFRKEQRAKSSCLKDFRGCPNSTTRRSSGP
jgi:hypothetical protein